MHVFHHICIQSFVLHKITSEFHAYIPTMSSFIMLWSAEQTWALLLILLVVLRWHFYFWCIRFFNFAGDLKISFFVSESSIIESLLKIFNSSKVIFDLVQVHARILVLILQLMNTQEKVGNNVIILFSWRTISVMFVAFVELLTKQ